jgi:hypothetical protein
MDRLKFLTYQGQRILLIDCSDCGPDELIEIFDEVERTIAAQPPKSIMTLTDFTGARFNRDAADRLKVVAAKDRPMVRRAAFVGAEAIPGVFQQALESFSVRKFPSFRTRDEAMAWLLAPEGEAAAS